MQLVIARFENRTSSRKRHRDKQKSPYAYVTTKSILSSSHWHNSPRGPPQRVLGSSCHPNHFRQTHATSYIEACHCQQTLGNKWPDLTKSIRSVAQAANRGCQRNPNTRRSTKCCTRDTTQTNPHRRLPAEWFSTKRPAQSSARASRYASTLHVESDIPALSPNGQSTTTKTRHETRAKPDTSETRQTLR